MLLFCYSAFRIIAIYNVICTKQCQCPSLAYYKQSVQVDTSSFSVVLWEVCLKQTVLKVYPQCVYVCMWVCVQTGLAAQCLSTIKCPYWGVQCTFGLSSGTSRCEVIESLCQSTKKCLRSCDKNQQLDAHRYTFTKVWGTPNKWSIWVKWWTGKAHICPYLPSRANILQYLCLHY